MKPHAFEERDRYNYPLCSGDLVINIGGFRGDFAAEINRIHHCRVIVFEPVSSFYHRIVERFASNPKIEVHHVGIGGRRETMRVYVAGDSSGIHERADAPVEQVPFWNAADMIRWTKCADIGLLELNCEGSEFGIIPELINNKLMDRVRNLQVQWHLLEPDSENRYRELRERLGATHEETWNFSHVWENWRRR